MRIMFSLFILVSACVQGPKAGKFSIDIWDNNYSMAYTKHYKINADSVIVTFISSIQDEGHKTLVNRKIKESEKNMLYKFLSSFPLDTLQNEYKDLLTADGDQKRIEVVFNDKKKTIDLENFYQEDMGRLFDAVNQVLEQSVQISYNR